MRDRTRVTGTKETASKSRAKQHTNAKQYIDWGSWIARRALESYGIRTQHREISSVSTTTTNDNASESPSVLLAAAHSSRTVCCFWHYTRLRPTPSTHGGFSAHPKPPNQYLAPIRLSGTYYHPVVSTFLPFSTLLRTPSLPPPPPGTGSTGKTKSIPSINLFLPHISLNQPPRPNTFCGVKACVPSLAR